MFTFDIADYDGTAVDVYWEPSRHAFTIRLRGEPVGHIRAITLVGADACVTDEDPAVFLHGTVAPNVVGLVGHEISYDPDLDPETFCDPDHEPVDRLTWVRAYVGRDGQPRYVGEPC